MGYTLTVYSVPYQALLAIPGSRDKQVLDQIQVECPFTKSIDELIDCRNEDTESPIRIRYLDAVRQILDGRPLEGAPGFVYGYALEGICWSLGSTLSNDAVPGLHFDELDTFLTESAVPLTILQLTCGGSPFPIPEPDDFPGIGFWTPELIKVGAGALKQLNRKEVPDYILECIETIDSWLAEAFEHEGDCLVGFVY
jgi:hypothetical protein